MIEPSQIASLMRWDARAEVSAESYARLRAHPRYAEAVCRFARNMLACGDDDRAMDGILKDAGRTMAAFCTAYLHASGGLTLPRLKALMAAFSVSSAGRARALLLYLRYLGYVELRPVRERGGPARYSPTAQFLSTYRVHMRAIVDAAHVLEPALAALLAGFGAPGVFETFVAHLCDALLSGQWRPDSAYARVFMHRYAGVQIMHALLAESGGDVFPPERPIAFSAAAAARRFKVSRIHVRRMVEAAETEGLLTLGEGTVTFTEAGREAVDWTFATQMILYLTGAARTLKARPDVLAGILPRDGWGDERRLA